jgi:hypothetical protein
MRCVGPRLVLLAALLAALPLACRRHQVEPPAQTNILREKLGARFDPKETGNITGTVTWTDDLPDVPPLHVLAPVDGKGPEDFPNPNRPIIDADSGQIEGALVYLLKVDRATSKPWSHAPVSVVFTDTKLEVRQGAAPTTIGIVELGDTISCFATVERNFSLKGRGVEFFSLPLVKPNVKTLQKMDKPGAVELSCGRGRYWLHDYLWVSDHPYVTKTKADGSFEFKRVPVGDYTVVCWMPNWHMLRPERNAENGEISRLIFEKALEKRFDVTVVPGETVTDTDFTWSNSDFRPREND